jgi:glyoxylase-like metal-dependent hydrolase (beta-lactamase superfamily II)
MKTHIYLLVIAVLAPNVASISGCMGQTLKNNEGQKIDSLIRVQSINTETILVTFGPDAVTAIHTDSGIVVIDAGISTGLTARYKAIIEQEFQDHRFLYVIHSHAHHDHVRGNSVFGDAQIVGHESCCKAILELGTEPKQKLERFRALIDMFDLQTRDSSRSETERTDAFYQKIRCSEAYEDIRNQKPIRVPDILFSDSLTIESGNMTFELFYFGECHSESDILIFVPDLGLLFTGDLFTTYGRPSISETNIPDRERCRKSILHIQDRMNHIKTVIGGHGQILTVEDLEAFCENLSKKCDGG